MRYVIREEPFGYTFFDKSKLRHRFVLKEKLNDLLAELQIAQDQIEILKTKRSDYRKDILYSPIRIYYELTLACSLRCRYCYNNSGIPRPNELSTAEILKSLDHFKECNILDLRFTGGELTCKRDWFEILKYAKNLGFAVSCNTNAAYFNSRIYEKFAELNLEQITVSLDGAKESHEMNRGKNTFDRTVENIKNLHSTGVRLRINTLVNKYSVRDVEKILEIASKYTDEINFFTIVFIGRGAHLEKTDGVSLDDHYLMSKKILRLKGKYPNLNILHFAEVSKTTAVDLGLNREFGIKMGHPSGTTTFNVISDGSYCCGGYTPYIDKNLAMGNVRTDDLFDVWQTNFKLEEIRNNSGKLIMFCQKCPKFIDNACQGSKYETELHRLLNPEVKNPNCIYGEGPSLLSFSSQMT